MKMGDLFIREPPGDKSTSDVAPDGLAAVDVGQASTSHVKLSWHFPSLGVIFLAGVTVRSITIIPSTQHNFTHYLFIPAQANNGCHGGGHRKEVFKRPRLYSAQAFQDI